MLPGETGGVLKTLNVDDETIKQILSILETSAGDLHGNHPPSLDAAYLGASDSGANLGHHTALAHQHVVTAMEQMVAGLHGYSANVEHWHRGMKGHDEAAAGASQQTTTKVEAAPTAVLPTIDQSTACTSAPDVTANTSCTLATGDGS